MVNAALCAGLPAPATPTLPSAPIGCLGLQWDCTRDPRPGEGIKGHPSPPFLPLRTLPPGGDHEERRATKITREGGKPALWGAGVGRDPRRWVGALGGSSESPFRISAAFQSVDFTTALWT